MGRSSGDESKSNTDRPHRALEAEGKNKFSLKLLRSLVEFEN